MSALIIISRVRLIIITRRASAVVIMCDFFISNIPFHVCRPYDILIVGGGSVYFNSCMVVCVIVRLAVVIGANYYSRFFSYSLKFPLLISILGRGSFSFCLQKQLEIRLNSCGVPLYISTFTSPSSHK